MGEIIADSIDLSSFKLNEKLASYIQFSLKIRDFVKERANLEQEFGKKLQSLAKKHTSKKALDSISDFADKDDAMSIKKCWSQLVQDATEQSKIHSDFAEILHQSVADRLKSMAVSKEDSRKNHLAFAQKLSTELDKINRQLQKSKSTYLNYCNIVELSKEKYQRTIDVKAKERLKKIWNQEIMDMNNAKNTYLLNLETANKFRSKYTLEYLPTVFDQYQEFGISCNKKLVSILKSYTLAYQKKFKSHLEIFENSSIPAVESVDPRLETEITYEPCNLATSKFEPCMLWKDEEKIVTDDFSKVYLGNTLVKLNRKLSQSTQDIKVMSNGLKGIENLIDAYQKNPLQGDPEKLLEEQLQEKRLIFFAKLNQFILECQIETIRGNVGEFSAKSCMHTFKPELFPIPTVCDFCEQNIWGVNKAGLCCKECGYFTHTKCEMKVPPTCTGVKRGKDSIVKPDIADIVEKSTIPGFNRSLTLTSQTTQTNLEKKVEVDGVLEPANHGMLQKTSIDFGSDGNADETLFLKPQKSSLDFSVSELLRESRMELEERTATIKSTSSIKPKPDISKIKPAMVLYDYLGTNGEELDIYQGEQVSVLKPDDGTGWTVIMKNGLAGVVPTSYLLFLEPFSDKLQEAVVLYEYIKNGKDEISVNPGDKVKIIQDDDGSGWMMVSLGAINGLVPASYIGSLDGKKDGTF